MESTGKKYKQVNSRLGGTHIHIYACTCNGLDTLWQLSMFL